MKEALAALIQTLNQRGWSPATSTNYSFIDEHQQCWVSRSGVNKAHFEATDFMTIDTDGMGVGVFHGVFLWCFGTGAHQYWRSGIWNVMPLCCAVNLI